MRSASQYLVNTARVTVGYKAKSPAREQDNSVATLFHILPITTITTVIP